MIGWRVRYSRWLFRRFMRYELPVIRSWVRAWWHSMKGHETLDWGDGWNCNTCWMDLETGKVSPKPPALEVSGTNKALDLPPSMG